MHNLFIVQSPFQLLSAIEGAHRFNQDINILILCYSPEETNNRQTRILHSYYSRWDRVIVVPPKKSTFLVGVNLLLVLKKLIRERLRPGRVFIGEYRSWQMMQFVYDLRPQDCFLLDDGNITIELQEIYLPTNQRYGKPSLKSRIVRRLLVTFLGLKPETNQIINLFTCFDLQPFSSSQRVLKHEFEYAKTFSQNKEVDCSVVYFFGGNISGAGLLSLERELGLLMEVKNHYEKKGLKTVYIPHRREDKHKIQRIREELNIETIDFDFPAEIEMLRRKTLPIGIASFYSTVLLTLPRIASFSSIQAFEFPLSELPQHYQSEVKKVYESLRGCTSIKVHEI